MPLEADVRLALLVAGAVGALDLDETVVAVERLGCRVDLERPELQARGALALGKVEQSGADALTPVGGVDVELADEVAVQRQQADHLALVYRDPAFLLRHKDIAEVSAHVVVAVRAADGGQRGAERAQPHLGHRPGVRGRRTPDHHGRAANRRRDWRMPQRRAGPRTIIRGESSRSTQRTTEPRRPGA